MAKTENDGCMIEKKEALDSARRVVGKSDYSDKVDVPQDDPELRTSEDLKKIIGDNIEGDFSSVVTSFREHWIVVFPFTNPDKNEVVDALYVAVDRETGEASIQS